MIPGSHPLPTASGRGISFSIPMMSSMMIDMNDLNANPSFHILNIQTRLRGDITGPDAFGAKTSGAIEAEFFGTSESDLNGFRLRHAYVQAIGDVYLFCSLLAMFMSQLVLLLPSFVLLFQSGIYRNFLKRYPNKIMVFGGDCAIVEGTYGASIMAREVVEKTLIAMVKSGYFCEEEAIVLAQKLLRSNAIKIYDLKGF